MKLVLGCDVVIIGISLATSELRLANVMSSVPHSDVGSVIARLLKSGFDRYCYFRVHSACITVTTTFCSTSEGSEVASSALLRVSILYHQLARCSGHEAAVVLSVKHSFLELPTSHHIFCFSGKMISTSIGLSTKQALVCVFYPRVRWDNLWQPSQQA